MNIRNRLLLAGFVMSAMGLAAFPVSADRGPGDGARKPSPQVRDKIQYRLDREHRHDRFYPGRGVVVDHLPRDRIVVPYRGDRFFFDAGVWYRPSGTRFVVVSPPVGLTVSVLPPFYTTLWVRGLPYYYADGVYYNWRPAERHYVVVEPPDTAEVASPPEEPETLYIYPKSGQSEAQQATDRYECHRWAVEQTGFDPTRPDDSGQTETQYAEKRADYQRATKACLEARDYSVR